MVPVPVFANPLPNLVSAPTPPRYVPGSRPISSAGPTRFRSAQFPWLGSYPSDRSKSSPWTVSSSWVNPATSDPGISESNSRGLPPSAPRIALAPVSLSKVEPM